MKALKVLLNIAIRVAIVYFLAEAWIFQDDPRFLNKAIPLRNTITVGLGSLVIPALWHLRRKKWNKYPLNWDSLYLSIYGLDMAGNSFNLYNSYYYFDLLPHFHGTGALGALLVFFWGNLRKLSFWESVLVATATATLIHGLLEMQEYYTDVLAGTINVRGIGDTVNDLAVGVLGALLYSALALRYSLKSRLQKHH